MNNKGRMKLALAALTMNLMAGCMAVPVLAQESGEISDGMFSWLLVQAYNAACTENGGTEELFEREIEGKTAEEWILEEAVSMSKEYLAVEQKFEESGMQIRADEAETIDETVERYWNELGYGRYYEEFEIEEEDFHQVLEHSTKITILYGEERSTLTEAVTDKEVIDYVEENGSLLQYIAVPYGEVADDAGDGTENAEAADAEYDEEAEAAVDAGSGDEAAADAGSDDTEAAVDVENGDETEAFADVSAVDTDALYEEYRTRLEAGEELETLVKEVSEDTDLQVAGVGSSCQGELAETVFYWDNTALSDEFREALREAAADEVIFFDDAAQDYQIIFAKKTFSAEWAGFETYREDIAGTLASETFEAEMAQWGEAMELTNEEELPGAETVKELFGK